MKDKIYNWIKDDLPVGMQMMITPDLVTKLMDRMNEWISTKDRLPSKAALNELNGGLNEWQDISTAPEFSRIIVCGWQPPHGRTIGYWWWHETEMAKALKPEHPTATHWCYPNLPAFPKPPAQS